VRELRSPVSKDRHDGGALMMRVPLLDLKAQYAGIREEVRAAIKQLPPKQRATLILRIYHELPHDEIARILGSSVGAAKANLFHALANLKKLLR